MLLKKSQLKYLIKKILKENTNKAFNFSLKRKSSILDMKEIDGIFVNSKPANKKLKWYDLLPAMVVYNYFSMSVNKNEIDSEGLKVIYSASTNNADALFNNIKFIVGTVNDDYRSTPSKDMSLYDKHAKIFIKEFLTPVHKDYLNYVSNSEISNLYKKIKKNPNADLKSDVKSFFASLNGIGYFVYPGTEKEHPRGLGYFHENALLNENELDDLPKYIEQGNPYNAHYDSEGNTISLGSKTDYSTFFHEIGHGLDDFLGFELVDVIKKLKDKIKKGKKINKITNKKIKSFKECNVYSLANVVKSTGSDEYNIPPNFANIILNDVNKFTKYVYGKSLPVQFPIAKEKLDTDSEIIINFSDYFGGLKDFFINKATLYDFAQNLTDDSEYIYAHKDEYDVHLSLGIRGLKSNFIKSNLPLNANTMRKFLKLQLSPSFYKDSEIRRYYLGLAKHGKYLELNVNSIVGCWFDEIVNSGKSSNNRNKG